jgi:hypothetical protein
VFGRRPGQRIRADKLDQKVLRLVALAKMSSGTRSPSGDHSKAVMVMVIARTSRQKLPDAGLANCQGKFNEFEDDPIRVQFIRWQTFANP